MPGVWKEGGGGVKPSWLLLLPFLPLEVSPGIWAVTWGDSKGGGGPRGGGGRSVGRFKKGGYR